MDGGFVHESRIHIVRHGSNLFGVRIRDHDTIRIHGFAKRIHVFTILLYNSLILKTNTFFKSTKSISVVVVGMGVVAAIVGDLAVVEVPREVFRQLVA
jgi:hypothetical protein